MPIGVPTDFYCLWGFCVGLCFGMHYFMFFLVLQSSWRVRESWLLCFYCFWMFCKYLVNVMWLFFMVPWLGLLVVIVVFPDHTHFFLMPTKRSAHHINIE